MAYFKFYSLLLLPTSGSTGLLFVLLVHFFCLTPRVLIFLSLSRFFVPWADLSGKDFDIRAPYRTSTLEKTRFSDHYEVGYCTAPVPTYRYGYGIVTVLLLVV